MNDEKIYEYLDYLDGRSSADHHKAIAKLEALGANIPSLLLKKYKISRRWSDRASCVYHCIEYAKTDKDAYQIGIIALHDKSRAVRRRACKLLSVAQKPEAIEHLEELLYDEASMNDAIAAINALIKPNHS